jgi:argininosuccinate lyase
MISACQRDEIVLCLARIEDDIELGKFQWVGSADIYTNIVQALADKLGDLPKDLAVDSIYESCIMILDMWCKNHIDHIMTKIKQLQVLFCITFLALCCIFVAEIIYPCCRYVFMLILEFTV